MTDPQILGTLAIDEACSTVNMAGAAPDYVRHVVFGPDPPFNEPGFRFKTQVFMVRWKDLGVIIPHYRLRDICELTATRVIVDSTHFSRQHSLAELKLFGTAEGVPDAVTRIENLINQSYANLGLQVIPPALFEINHPPRPHPLIVQGRMSLQEAELYLGLNDMDLARFEGQMRSWIEVAPFVGSYSNITGVYYRNFTACCTREGHDLLAGVLQTFGVWITGTW